MVLYFPMQVVEGARLLNFSNEKEIGQYMGAEVYLLVSAFKDKETAQLQICIVQLIHCGVFFLCMHEKGNAACGLLIKWKLTFQK